MTILRMVVNIYILKTNNLIITKILVKNYKVKGLVVDNDIPVNTYGVDLADEMTKILSEQLAKEIDRDILRSLGLEPDRNKRRKKFNL